MSDKIKTYTLYWYDGKREVVHGKDIADAVRRNGYGGGAIAALSHYSSGDCHNWKWDKEKKDWVKAKENIPNPWNVVD